MLSDKKELTEVIEAILFVAGQGIEIKDIAEKLEKTKRQLSQIDDIKKIEKFTKILEKNKEGFLDKLLLFETLESIKVKNEERIDYIDAKFKKIGIYDKILDKKSFKTRFNEISNRQLTGNEEIFNTELSKKYILFQNNYKFEIVNRKLDFSIKFNEKVLIENPEIALSFAFKYFSKSVSTISVDALLNVGVKKTLLKKLAYYVFDKSQSWSMLEINKSLGNLLNFSFEVVSSPKQFVQEVQNLFNVLIAKRLNDLEVEHIDEIIKKLKCRFNSKFL